MSATRPDFENWTDEDFETRADEVCAYAHSVELSDADWMSGAEYRLRIVAERACQSDGMADERLRPLVAEARAAGSLWDRVGKMLGTSAADARERFSDLDRPVGVRAAVD